MQYVARVGSMTMVLAFCMSCTSTQDGSQGVYQAALATPGAIGPITYDCGTAGGKLNAVFVNSDSPYVAVDWNGEDLSLPQAISGSGARYADDTGREFWEHQGELRFTPTSGETITCKKTAQS